MTSRRLLAVAVTLTLGACGAQPEAPVPAATELGYTMPAANPIAYDAADTARVNIHLAPGQSMEQTMGQNSTVRLTFAPVVGTAGNLSVTAAYVDYGAFMESSMMPREDIGSEGVEGDFVLSLTPEGELELISGPDLPDAVEQMAMGDNRFADLFLRLPNEVVTPGATWTDTVRTDEETEEAHTTNETIVVSTFRGDTTIGGGTLWIIESTKTMNVVVEGEMQGMTMRNELSGSMAERALWDPARRLLYSSQSSGSMSGTVSVPSAGMNDIPLDVTTVRYIRLVEAGS